MAGRLRTALFVAAIATLSLVVACGDDTSSATTDAGVPDASVLDVSTRDAATEDASSEPDAAMVAPEPADGARSGTRLQVVHWQAADGFRFWSGRFFDKVLGQECVPARWTDGKIRCTPPSWQLQTRERGAFDTKVLFDAQDPQSAGVAYGRDDCTDPEAVVTSGVTVTAQTLAIELEPETCGLGVDNGFYQFDAANDVAHVYHVGSARSDVSAHDKELPPQGCAYSFNLSNVGGTAYEIGEELPASAFVELTPSFAPTAGEFTASLLTSEDGAVYPRSARSTTFGGDCYFRYLYGSSHATCVPERLATGFNAGSGTFFEDALCLTVAVSTPRACQPPVGVSTAFVGGAAVD